jgi:hypothetical protein
MAKLTGKPHEALMNALIEAAPSPEDLRITLRFKVEKTLDAIALGAMYQEIVCKVIADADARGWMGRVTVARAMKLMAAHDAFVRVLDRQCP